MSTAESTQQGVAAWFGQRLPKDWTSPAPRVVVDREEITVTITLSGPQAAEDTASERTEAEAAQARAGYLARWRDETREQRIGIAREAEHRFARKVAWAVRVGEHEEVFTHLAVPVMTRLRQGERQVLDTLVDAGVARSRAHALAWCVRLVGEHADTWLAELRTAMERVAQVRDAGPGAAAG